MLDHRTNTKVKDYLNLTFQNFLIPVINKPTRVTKANATLIEHILTNDFLYTGSSTGIVKSDFSDHSRIFLIASVQYLDNIQSKTTIRKREINEKSRQYFMEILNEVNWKHLYSLADTNLAYEYFLRTFSGFYNHTFPIKEVSLKFKMTSILGKNDIPKRMVIDGIETFDQNKIANGFNKYFTKIGPKLAASISASSKVFKQFMNVSKTVLQEYALQDQELEEGSNSLKPNKSPGFDDISSVVKFWARGILNPLKHIFNLLLETGIFPNAMKIARVSTIFKKGEEFFFTN